MMTNTIIETILPTVPHHSWTVCACASLHESLENAVRCVGQQLSNCSWLLVIHWQRSLPMNTEPFNTVTATSYGWVFIVTAQSCNYKQTCIDLLREIYLLCVAFINDININILHSSCLITRTKSVNYINKIIHIIKE